MTTKSSKSSFLKIKIQFGLIILLAIIALSLVLSQTASPDSTALFALKRVQEKMYLKLKSNPQEKLEYMRILLNNRLEELDSQVKRQKYGYILPSASRYSTLAGQITDMVISGNLNAQIQSIKEQFQTHQKLLQKIYEIYPKNTDNVEYKYIEDDINYLKIYQDKQIEFFKSKFSDTVFYTDTTLEALAIERIGHRNIVPTQ